MLWQRVVTSVGWALIAVVAIPEVAAQTPASETMTIVQGAAAEKCFPGAARVLGTARPMHAANVGALAFHPTQPWLASGGEDRAIRIWKLEDGSLHSEITHLPYRVTELRFLPDGRLVALIASSHFEPRYWSDSRSMICVFALRDKLWYEQTRISTGDHIKTIAVSSDGTRLFADDSSQSVQVYDPRGANLRVVQDILFPSGVHTPDMQSEVRLGNYFARRPDERPLWLDVSADGKRLAILTHVALRLYQVDQRCTMLAELATEGRAITVSPDGTWIVKVAPEGNLASYLFDGKRLLEHTVHLEQSLLSVQKVAFSEDGSQLWVSQTAGSPSGSVPFNEGKFGELKCLATAAPQTVTIPLSRTMDEFDQKRLKAEEYAPPIVHSARLGLVATVAEGKFPVWGKESDFPKQVADGTPVQHLFCLNDHRHVFLHAGDHAASVDLTNGQRQAIDSKQGMPRVSSNGKQVVYPKANRRTTDTSASAVRIDALAEDYATLKALTGIDLSGVTSQQSLNEGTVKYLSFRPPGVAWLAEQGTSEIGGTVYQTSRWRIDAAGKWNREASFEVFAKDVRQDRFVTSGNGQSLAYQTAAGHVYVIQDAVQRRTRIPFGPLVAVSDGGDFALTLTDLNLGASVIHLVDLKNSWVSHKWQVGHMVTAFDMADHEKYFVAADNGGRIAVVPIPALQQATGVSDADPALLARDAKVREEWTKLKALAAEEVAAYEQRLTTVTDEASLSAVNCTEPYSTQVIRLAELYLSNRDLPVAVEILASLFNMPRVKANFIPGLEESKRHGAWWRVSDQADKHVQAIANELLIKGLEEAGYAPLIRPMLLARWRRYPRSLVDNARDLYVDSSSREVQAVALIEYAVWNQCDQPTHPRSMETVMVPPTAEQKQMSVKALHKLEREYSELTVPPYGNVGEFAKQALADLEAGKSIVPPATP